MPLSRNETLALAGLVAIMALMMYSRGPQTAKDDAGAHTGSYQSSQGDAQRCAAWCRDPLDSSLPSALPAV